jgi:protein-S-isoprenylcysteine O-methyltransferase Ste14
VSQPRKFWMRWRVRVGYPVAVLYWLLATPMPHSIAIGAALAAAGLIVRAAASGQLRKNEELARSGIYAHTRNPLYLGSAILAAGFIIAGHSLSAGLLVAVYFCVFYYAVMRNEEDELREKFGAAFQEYAASVPLFLPNIVRAAKRSADGQTPQDFSWQQYRRNREYKALIGTVGAFAVVWLRMWLRARYGY